MEFTVVFWNIMQQQDGGMHCDWECLALRKPAGPAANPTADWAQIEASLFTQLRLWQRHQLSRDGALYILSTHVFSRTWFLARYRPPSPQVLVKRLDSAAVKAPYVYF